MATQKSALDQWADLNEIEYKLKLKSENGVPPEDGWTNEQRLIATVNEIHFCSYRIERRQEILFNVLHQLQTSQKIDGFFQKVDRILLIAAVLLLLYVALR